MPGIMLLTDPDWQAFQAREAVGRIAVFYASPAKRTNREHLDPLFCVRPGTLPRSIVAVGRVQAQVELHQDAAWATYGTTLGAATEADWREQAAAVLENSRRTFNGRILAIELVDFKEFPDPILPQEVGLTDDGWSSKKQIEDPIVAHLMAIVDGPAVLLAPGEAPNVGAGFGDPENNREVEQAAIQAVTQYYQERHWHVVSVEDEDRGYDLACTNAAAELHVEVKGVAGNLERFIITAGEVRRSREDPQWSLAVVTSALTQERQITLYDRAQFHQRFTLATISYTAALRPPAAE